MSTPSATGAWSANDATLAGCRTPGRSELSVFGLRLRTLLHFYGRRLRKHPVQEAFAATGIAVGVALVFAVQVANTSITGSADQVVNGIIGSAKLQLAARSEEGFSERVVARVERVPGVEHVAPLWRTRVTVVGPKAVDRWSCWAARRRWWAFAVS